MAGQPKTKAKREANGQASLDPRELLSVLTDRDMELIAGAWLTKKGIDPRSLSPSRAQLDLPQFNLPWKPVFLLALRDTGNVRSAATAAGVSRQLVYQHRETDDLFRDWWNTALADAVDLLEMSAWALASRLDGPMIRFLLMSHRPETYAPSVGVTHKGSKEEPIQVEHQHQVAVYLPHNGRDDLDASRTASAPAEVRLLGTEEQLALEQPGSDAIDADWQPQEDEDEV